MSKILGNGAPTRKTPGALGDIYIDKATGNLYECVFAYRDITDNEFDTQWKEIPGSSDKIKSEKNPSGDIQEKQIEDAVVKPVFDVSPEPTPKFEKNYDTRKRTDYSSYSKKKR